MPYQTVKRGALAGIIASVIIVAGIVAYSSSDTGHPDPDMQRQHGDISTAMGSPLLGSPDAPVTIVEFGDYQCHACHAWFLNTAPAVKRDYIETGKASLVFVDFAFLGRDSPRAAEASHCAGDQGMYWEYHDLMYNSQEEKIDSWADSERLRAFAFSLGLEMGQFEICLDSGKYSKRVQYNIAQGREAGTSSTPTFFIVGPDGQQEMIVGAQPYSVFKQVIDSMV